MGFGRDLTGNGKLGASRDLPLVVASTARYAPCGFPPLVQGPGTGGCRTLQPLQRGEKGWEAGRGGRFVSVLARSVIRCGVVWRSVCSRPSSSTTAGPGLLSMSRGEMGFDAGSAPALAGAGAGVGAGVGADSWVHGCTCSESDQTLPGDDQFRVDCRIPPGARPSGAPEGT